uniref:SFRICE_003568 n=1 Tax=Spodoptera frugiperda TaxID=7108 RepID=A0A2H1WMI2_SPOFR
MVMAVTYEVNDNIDRVKFLENLLFSTNEPPQLRMSAMVIYYARIIHIKLPLESLYRIKIKASKSVA